MKPHPLCADFRRVFACLAALIALSTGAALATPSPSKDVKPDVKPDIKLDVKRLPRLLAKRGFQGGPDFKAVVARVEILDGRVETRWYSYGQTARDRENWWPASTIKLFAAIAALERAQALGVSPEATLELRYPKKPVTVTLAHLVRRAITPSDNQAYDRLVEFAGVAWLNDTLFTPAHGLGETVLLRAYSGRVRDKKTGRGTLRFSPEIRVTEGDKAIILPATHATKPWDCVRRHGGEGNCTTLLNLAEALRRVMLHEHLPPKARYALSPEALTLLRGALSGKRSRGMNVVDGLRAGLGRRASFFSKPGYAADWFSDVVYIHAPADPARKLPERRWLVSMANQPGRDCLDEAARHVGALLAADLFP
ncbi:class A beta-lactamase-related serine hydrolase [Myxococcota bacterium]|nr:class A beta-lactamase-related serine hydrolase [Myxococcota bacterium]MBU1900519.1 class A beta-lactamase-related serine hydrolase [Myxococcota bacterium]